MNLRILAGDASRPGGQDRGRNVSPRSVFSAERVPDSPAGFSREWRDDIVPLAEHFLRRFDTRLLPLLPVTAQYLLQQPWLGNVREIPRNALEHAVIVRGAAHCCLSISRQIRGYGPVPTRRSNSAPPSCTGCTTASARAVRTVPITLYEDLLRCVEPPLLEELMRRLQGNRVLAAQWLGSTCATPFARS